MNLCDMCDDIAVGTIKGQTDAEAQPLCQLHAQERRAALDSTLSPYSFVSITHTPVSVESQLHDTLKMLEATEGAKQALAAKVAQQAARLNEKDQECQRLGVLLGRANERIMEAEQATQRLQLDLELANDRLERAEVEALTGVDTDPDSDGPPSKVEGGNPPAER